MDAEQFFYERHEEIVSLWFDMLHNDQSIRYHKEPPQNLRRLMNYAALAFRRVMLEDYWDDLQGFITHIAKKRFSEGFKVSEVQKAFEYYRQTLIPLLFVHIDPEKLEPLMTKLQECMVFTITHFSEYFQDIHENFVSNHTKILESQIQERTHELAESRQKYKTLVEDINEGFFVLTEGRIVFANPMFAKMHGYELCDVLQKSYLNFIAEEHKEKIRKVYELSLGLSQSRVPERIEYLRFCKDGTKQPTEIMAKRTIFGDQISNIGICRDISERIGLEQKTREAEKMKALAQQAASLAHEVRNPLSTLRINLQLLSRIVSDVEQTELLQASLEEVVQIDKSLQEMMDISAPLRLSPKPIHLRELFERCLNVMRPRLTTNQVRATLRLKRGAECIRADSHRMEQVLVNLLFNAVEAQPSGGRVSISARPFANGAETWVEILISDQGPGVPKEILPYLFDPMFSQKAMGTGLGLHNVKRVVEAHGGSVRAKLNRMRGIRFYLTLPAR